jgi:hypothetical protein
MRPHPPTRDSPRALRGLAARLAATAGLSLWAVKSLTPPEHRGMQGRRHQAECPPLADAVIEALYGTASVVCQGGEWEGWFREAGLSVPIEARSFLNGIELAQAYPDTNAACAASQSW